MHARGPGSTTIRNAPGSHGSSAWDAETLQHVLATFYRGRAVIVLSNREPFQHEETPGGGIVVKRSASGLVTALEPLMRACSGVWVAHGVGSADRVVVDRRDGLDVPSSNSSYRLRRVWLERHEAHQYYDGFANEGLWPLCHRVHVQPIFRSSDFSTYRTVNLRFAQAVCEEATGDRPTVLVQDYHFAIAPRAIRERLPLSTIIAFWHIPWPSPRDLAICPFGPQLLEGLLGSTLVGFQTPDDCRNFIDCVDQLLDARVDENRTTLSWAGRSTAVGCYPVSVDWNQAPDQSPPIETCRRSVRRQLGVPPDVRLGLGVDRLDYTKGIREKFLAVEELLERRPDLQGHFVLVQIAEPSREVLAAYQALRVSLRETAERINIRFGRRGYRPIILLDAHHEPADVCRFMRAADVCYVGSLHDGMNLVAKEFVRARTDERGVLILSRFAGAARELTAALIVNPYAIDAVADALAAALQMTDEEQSTRMRRLRSVVAEFSTYRWAGEMLMDAAMTEVGHRSEPVW